MQIEYLRRIGEFIAPLFPFQSQVCLWPEPLLKKSLFRGHMVEAALKRYQRELLDSSADDDPLFRDFYVDQSSRSRVAGRIPQKKESVKKGIISGEA